VSNDNNRKKQPVFIINKMLRLISWLTMAIAVVHSQTTYPPPPSPISNPVNCTALGFTLAGRGYNFLVNHTMISNYNWNVARGDCKSIHNMSDLALLYDPINFNLVYSTVNQQCYFIGLRQNVTNGFEPDFNWTWIDGTPFGKTIFGFAEWCNGNPDDYKGTQNAGGLWRSCGIDDIQTVEGICGKICAIPSISVLFHILSLIFLTQVTCAKPQLAQLGDTSTQLVHLILVQFAMKVGLQVFLARLNAIPVPLGNSPIVQEPRFA
jgi:hypothetical protein